MQNLPDQGFCVSVLLIQKFKRVTLFGKNTYNEKLVKSFKKYFKNEITTYTEKQILKHFLLKNKIL